MSAERVNVFFAKTKPREVGSERRDKQRDLETFASPVRGVRFVAIGAHHYADWIVLEWPRDKKLVPQICRAIDQSFAAGQGAGARQIAESIRRLIGAADR
jgi:hypothetical protein